MANLHTILLATEDDHEKGPYFICTEFGTARKFVSVEEALTYREIHRLGSRWQVVTVNFLAVP